MVFRRTLPVRERVTDLALTPCGNYIIAVGGEGLVRLFNLARRNDEGAVLHHFQARGLHTSLLLKVSIVPDGSYAFCGANRGSMECAALDLSGLPRDSAEAARCQDLSPFVRRFAHSDAKIKGIGAAVAAAPSEDGARTYRLFCGLGIKNIHIWHFQDRSHLGEEPTWTLLVDTQTNGMTMELIGFRRGGLQAVSKSANHCVRVWDLSGLGAAAEETPFRPAHADVSNTQDARCLSEDLVFGGVGELSMVAIDGAKGQNRSDMELPSDAPSSGSGAPGAPASSRRRRALRAVCNISASPCGARAIVACSDGSVLLYDAAKGLRAVLPANAVEAERVGSRESLWALATVADGAPAAARFSWCSRERRGVLQTGPLASVAAAFRQPAELPPAKAPQRQRKAPAKKAAAAACAAGAAAAAPPAKDPAKGARRAPPPSPEGARRKRQRPEAPAGAKEATPAAKKAEGSADKSAAGGAAETPAARGGAAFETPLPAAEERRSAILSMPLRSAARPWVGTTRAIFSPAPVDKATPVEKAPLATRRLEGVASGVADALKRCNAASAHADEGVRACLRAGEDAQARRVEGLLLAEAAGLKRRLFMLKHGDQIPRAALLFALPPAERKARGGAASAEEELAAFRRRAKDTLQEATAEKALMDCTRPMPDLRPLVEAALRWASAV